MKTSYAFALCLAALAPVHLTIAQTATHPHTVVPVKEPQAVSDMTRGVIQKIDPKAKTLTIKHGDIKNLNMPAMTMVFRVKIPAMMDGLKVGDKLRFHAEEVSGALVLTELVKDAP